MMTVKNYGRVVFVGLCVLASLAIASGQAKAASSQFTLDSFALPTHFSELQNNECLETIGEEPFRTVACDAYKIIVKNSTNTETDGSPITIEDALPEGVTLRRIAFYWSGIEGADFGPNLCTTVPVRCKFPVSLAPDAELEMFVYVTVSPGAPGKLSNAVTVSGGGFSSSSTREETTVSDAPATFGVQRFNSEFTDPEGKTASQAGAHPYELTTRLDLNSEIRQPPDLGRLDANSVQDVRDVVVELPLGMVGSTLSASRCTFAELSAPTESQLGGCPQDTEVGLILAAPFFGNRQLPIFNMVPEHGFAAEFGFVDPLKSAHMLYAQVVPGASGYVLRVTSPEVSQVALTDVGVTFFGFPVAKDGGGSQPSATFTNPAWCSGEPMTTTVHIDSWQAPGRVGSDGFPDFSDPRWLSATSTAPPVTGCNLLQFDPAFTLQPDTTQADSPSGLTVTLSAPQPEAIGTLATPPLRKAVVTLPAGVSVDPSAAGGLAACSPAEIALSSPDAPTCPRASDIGTVELTTPALPGVLTGAIYLATQGENPFHSLLAGYIVVNDPTTGVVVKIPGELTLNPANGQITGVFDENPQFPFSELRLRFKGGTRGAVATPNACGSYSTSATLTPWSAPNSGPAAEISSGFAISSGCVHGFAPTFLAGATNPMGGGYSPFVLSFGRSDTDEELAGVSVKLPPGLLAKIAGVAQCSDSAVARAAERTGAEETASPSCPEGSRIGSARAVVGPGPNPYSLTGSVYLTGPYKGAPYGLAVVVPATAGPFDLGTVVVRQALEVDPVTAQVTDVSDPLPTIVKGIPVRLRRVDATVDRPDFTLNGTRCDAMAVEGDLVSATGASAAVRSRYQAAGCASLKFKPGFKVSTQAKTSRQNGASLHVLLTYPNAPQGTQANVKSVHVELPKALPSRLSTLNHACTDSVFIHDPAGCPPQSRVGFAKAVTPLLSVPMEGPAYFVSHGGAKFPELIVVLQGGGITIDLAGETFISKASVTSSTFRQVPDVPVTSFELTLPEGPFSALGANTNLCTTSLAMPTTFTGQNGAILKQNTKIAVTGCRPAIHVLGHSVKGARASISVSVPSAGTLVASGKGIGRSVKRAGKAGVVMIGVTLSGRDLRVLAKNPHQRVNARVQLRFKPKRGAALTAHVRLLMG